MRRKSHETTTGAKPPRPRRDDQVIHRRATPKSPAAASRFDVMLDEMRRGAEPGNPGQQLLPPSMTSTTTPDGIGAHDPDAIVIVDAPPGTPGQQTGASRRAPAAPPGASRHDPGQENSWRALTIDVGLIEVGHNPRKAFDAEPLAELAASIRQHGVIEPVVCRYLPMHERAGTPPYELVAGERRLRAAKAAGLDAVPARVREMTDQEADEMRLVENLQRQDLNALEEAAAFQQLLKDHGTTQEQLAERLGKSQPHVANRLRLLKLPKAWQSKIISGEITATHARALLEWVAYPQVMARFEKEYFKGKHPQAIGSADDFENDLTWMAHAATRAIEGSRYDYKSGARIEHFTPTDGQRDKLAIVMIDNEERATNVKLWDRLQSQHVIAARKQAAAGAKSKAAKKKAANKKGQASLQVQREAEQIEAQRLADAIDEWRDDWLHILLAARAVRDVDFALRVAWVCWTFSEEPPGCNAIRACLKSRERDADKLTAAAADVDDPRKMLVSLATLSAWDPNARTSFMRSMIPEAALEPLARRAKIDLAAEWKKNLGGRLTEAFFNLHSDAQLHALAGQMRVDLAGAKTRKDRIARLVKSPSTKRQLPKCIAPIAGKSSKRAARKKGGRR